MGWSTKTPRASQNPDIELRLPYYKKAQFFLQKQKKQKTSSNKVQNKIILYPPPPPPIKVPNYYPSHLSLDSCGLVQFIQIAHNGEIGVFKASKWSLDLTCAARYNIQWADGVWSWLMTSFHYDYQNAFRRSLCYACHARAILHKRKKKSRIQ